jgi:hypothetical protein
MSGPKSRARRLLCVLLALEPIEQRAGPLVLRIRGVEQRDDDVRVENDFSRRRGVPCLRSRRQSGPSRHRSPRGSSARMRPRRDERGQLLSPRRQRRRAARYREARRARAPAVHAARGRSTAKPCRKHNAGGPTREGRPQPPIRRPREPESAKSRPSTPCSVPFESRWGRKFNSA